MRDNGRAMEEIIAYYQQFIDVETLREDLKLTPTQRIERMMEVSRYYEEQVAAGRVMDLNRPGAQAELWREWKKSKGLA